MVKKTESSVTVLRKFRDYLACSLTDAEKMEKGRALAGALEDIRGEESRAEMLKQSLKSAMASAEAKRDALMVIVSRGEEIREIEIEERADVSTLSVYRVRMDTGEVTHERTMTPEERQQQLALVDAPTGGPIQ